MTNTTSLKASILETLIDLGQIKSLDDIPDSYSKYVDLIDKSHYDQLSVVEVVL